MDIDLEALAGECDEEFFVAGGPGGQHRNRTESGVLFHLIGNTVFLRLSDVASGLPTYTEQVAVCALDQTQHRRADAFFREPAHGEQALFERFQLLLKVLSFHQPNRPVM